MQILGVTVFALADDWQLPITAFSTAMAAGHAGSAVGAAVGGMPGDRFGRKPVAVAGTFLFGALTVATVIAATPAAVVALRFAAGLGLGGCLPPALALLTEKACLRDAAALRYRSHWYARRSASRWRGSSQARSCRCWAGAACS